MAPRWLTLEKLVSELGSVCTTRSDAEALGEKVSAAVDETLREATQAVTEAVTDPAQQDEVVREAWTAIARAQDAIAQLRDAVERSRVVRRHAEALQDQSMRLRYAMSPPPRISGAIAWQGTGVAVKPPPGAF
jgi:acyl-CoA reductase-like NAD-dependent aldehyde dehydrogenase